MSCSCTEYIPAEQGTIIFIGSTTENPYASMTPAIVSRCRIFEFKRLSEEDIRGAMEKALKDIPLKWRPKPWSI